MAGCAGGDGRDSESTKGGFVEGWVTDARLIGIPSASITVAGSKRTMRAYHPAGSFPIRYLGQLYFVGVDWTSGQ